MLHQSLPANFIMSQALAFCRGLRDETGSDLTDVQIPAAAVVYDLLRAIGIPDKVIGLALNPAEMNELAMGDNPGAIPLRCQLCDEEATQLVPYRGNHLLLCDDHAYKIETTGQLQH
jgi:hypothetical protein